MGIIFFVGF